MNYKTLAKIFFVFLVLMVSVGIVCAANNEEASLKASSSNLDKSKLSDWDDRYDDDYWEYKYGYDDDRYDDDDDDWDDYYSYYKSPSKVKKAKAKELQKLKKSKYDSLKKSKKYSTILKGNTKKLKNKDVIGIRTMYDDDDKEYKIVFKKKNKYTKITKAKFYFKNKYTGRVFVKVDYAEFDDGRWELPSEDCPYVFSLMKVKVYYRSYR